MKTIKTKSDESIHLFKFLGVTEEQFMQARDWYLSAQQDTKVNHKKQEVGH